MTRLRRLAQLVLQVDDTPTRVAASFGVGMFIAFFPIFGTHTAIALAVAFLFRLNRVAVLSGAWMSNPWTIVPMWTFGALVGCAMLGVSPRALGQIDWSLSGRAFYDSLASGLVPLLWPFILGNVATGVVSGGVSFFVLRSILKRRSADEGEAGETTEA